MPRPADTAAIGLLDTATPSTRLSFSRFAANAVFADLATATPIELWLTTSEPPASLIVSAAPADEAPCLYMTR